MKVVVFGGAGFLGSHVADALSDQGFRVTIFDLRPSPYLRKDQAMLTGDILDRSQVESALSGCDYVYNFAGLADLDDATTKPLDTVRLNVMGSINIMDAAIRAGVKRYLYASSIYVYSQKGGFYRCSKQSSEIYIEEYQRRFGLDFTILRYGTLYGPRADGRNSIYRYLNQALETGCIICSGNGEEQREYIDVRDAARLSVEALTDEYCNKCIIISGPYSMKLKDMLYMLKEIMGKDIKFKFNGNNNPDHYDYTPYSYAPKTGYKLISHKYLEMGQGLIECFEDMQTTANLNQVGREWSK